MKNNILVSVVLPCYNAEDYILEAVKSILGQTYKNIELIVVDDCSTDGSLLLLESINDSRLKICSTNKNSGYPTAMNVGISMAKGKYIARMDADDVCSLDRIELQVNLHEQYPNCAFVSSKRCLLSPNGIAYTKDKIINDNSFVEESWEDLFNGTRTFTDASSLVLKKHIDELGAYNTYQRSGMDVDLWFRIIEKTGGKVLVLNKFLYWRRLLPNAITFSSKTNHSEVFNKAYKNHYNKPYRIVNKNGAKEEKLKPHIRFLSTIAIHCFLVNDYKGFYSFFRKSLSYKKFIFESVFVNMMKKYYRYKKDKTLKIINV